MQERSEIDLRRLDAEAHRSLTRRLVLAVERRFPQFRGERSVEGVSSEDLAASLIVEAIERREVTTLGRLVYRAGQDAIDVTRRARRRERRHDQARAAVLARFRERVSSIFYALWRRKSSVASWTAYVLTACPLSSNDDPAGMAHSSRPSTPLPHHIQVERITLNRGPRRGPQPPASPREFGAREALHPLVLDTSAPRARAQRMVRPGMPRPEVGMRWPLQSVTPSLLVPSVLPAVAVGTWVCALEDRSPRAEASAPEPDPRLRDE